MKIPMWLAITITAIVTVILVVVLARLTNQHYQNIHQSDPDYRPLFFSKELIDEFKKHNIQEITFIKVTDDQGKEKQVAQIVLSSDEKDRISSESISDLPNTVEIAGNNKASSELENTSNHHSLVLGELAFIFATSTSKYCPPLAWWEPSTCKIMGDKEASNSGGNEGKAHCHCYWK